MFSLFGFRILGIFLFDFFVGLEFLFFFGGGGVGCYGFDLIYFLPYNTLITIFTSGNFWFLSKRFSHPTPGKQLVWRVRLRFCMILKGSDGDILLNVCFVHSLEGETFQD